VCVCVCVCACRGYSVPRMRSSLLISPRRLLCGGSGGQHVLPFFSPRVRRSFRSNR
jgi:hypothetical protein